MKVYTQGLTGFRGTYRDKVTFFTDNISYGNLIETLVLEGGERDTQSSVTDESTRWFHSGFTYVSLT